MTDEELEERLFEELQDRIRPPYGAPDTLRRRVGSLEMMEPVRYGARRGMPRAFLRPRNFAAAAAVAVLIGSLVLFRQSSPHPAGSVKLPASFEMFGRIDANAAWAEDGADLYITRDDGGSWTKGTVPGGRSMRTLLLQPADPTAPTDAGLGFDHLYPVFVDADHGWLLSWTVSNPSSCQTWEWTLTLWRTSDGARSWQSAQLPGTYKGYGTVQFTDAQHGWVTVNRMDSSICSLQGGSSEGSGPVTTVGPAMEQATPEPTATSVALPEDALTVLSTSDGGVTWSRASTLAALGIVYFTGTGEAWGYGTSDAGNVDLVLHSTDGARTWTTAKLPLPSGASVAGIGQPAVEDGGTASLRLVAYQSGPTRFGASDTPNVSYSGPNYEILTFASSDGGKTWKLDATRAIPGDSVNLLTAYYTMSQTPASQPIAAVENSWDFTQTSGTPASFQASFDGGVSWQSYSTKGLPGAVGMAVWASPDDVWVMSNGGSMGPSGSPAYIYTTRDAGNTWTGLGGAPTWPAPAQPAVTPFVPQVEPSSFVEPAAPSSVMSIGRVDARVGWAAVNGPSGNNLQMTSDGGATWSELRALPDLGEIQFVDENRGWLLNTISISLGSSQSLTVFATSDGGRSWQASPVDMGSMPDGVSGVMTSTSFGGLALFDGLHFRDATHGELYLTVGYGADGSDMTKWKTVCRQASTTDGGATWSAPTDGPCMGQATFTSESIGYAPSWDGGPTVYVTSDGGRTWVSGNLPPSKVETPTSPGLSPVLMVERRSDGSLRALVSSSGSTDVDVSTDGGKTWVQSGPAVGLIGTSNYGVAWLGEGNWIAVQTDSTIGGFEDEQETFDGGLTWTHVFGQGLEAMGNGMAFVSPTDGWIAGAYSVCQNRADGSTVCQGYVNVIATSDGGQTWNAILTP